MSGAGPGGESVLATTVPDEDIGASTQAAYAWQHHCTTLDCMGMLTDPSIVAVVCECHEDYLILREKHTELVSCKTLNPGATPQNLNQFCKDGGIGHLYSRWLLETANKTRLMTNAGLRPGERQAGELAALADRVNSPTDLAVGDLELRDALASSLVWAAARKNLDRVPKKMPDGVEKDDFLEKVTLFICSLRIKYALPAADHIEAVHIANCRGAISTVSGDDEKTERCYKAVFEAVVAANTAKRTDYLAWATGQSDQSDRGLARTLIAAPRISKQDVFARIDRACRETRDGTPVSAVSRLQAKLVAGGIGDTRISSATRLRDAWKSQWARMRSGLPGDAAVRDALETLVLEIAGDAEAKCASEAEHYGDDMYELLRGTLPEEYAAPDGYGVLGRKELMGVAMDLSSACHVWFSPRFNVDDVLRAAAEAE